MSSMENTLYSIYTGLDKKQQEQYLKLIKEDYPKDTYESLMHIIELHNMF